MRFTTILETTVLTLPLALTANALVTPREPNPSTSEFSLLKRGGERLMYIYNSVYFEDQSPIKMSGGQDLSRVLGGSFTITKHLKVTNDKYNPERNGKDKVLPINPNMKGGWRLTFDVARKKSDPVGTYFINEAFTNSDGVKAQDKCTFGHEPGQLNFVFVGDLVLRVRDPDYDISADKVLDLKFQNIVLAQGHNGKNNWWFGGDSCRKQHARDRVQCEAECGKETYTVEFMRGGKGNHDNDVSEVGVGRIKKGCLGCIKLHPPNEC